MRIQAVARSRSLFLFKKVDDLLAERQIELQKSKKMNHKDHRERKEMGLFAFFVFSVVRSLRLSDGLSPGMASNPSGNFCVHMPCRCVAEAEDAPEVGAEQAAVPVIAAIAA
jgi:hypothetical protein